MQARSGVAEQQLARGVAKEGETAAAVRDNDNKTVQKELVVIVEVDGADVISMFELLKAVEVTCGRVLGCRAKEAKRWELTMSNRKGKERRMDGFKIKGSRIIASEVVRDTRVVSFLNLPLYITDEQIIEKLLLWGVGPVSAIRRKKWPGTEVYDGTRFLKVTFPDSVSSLPYSTKFETLEGLEYFRVLHDQQVRVCRLCLQPGHILRECPEFHCFRCKKQGHYARECEQQVESVAEGSEEASEEEDATELEEEEEDGDSEAAGGDFSGMELNRGEEGELLWEVAGGRRKKERGGGSQKVEASAESSERSGDRSAATKGRGEGERSRSPLSRRESSAESLPCAQKDAATGQSDTEMVRGQVKEEAERGKTEGKEWGKRNEECALTLADLFLL